MDYHPPPLAAAAAAAGELRYERKGSFLGSKVRKAQGLVCVDNDTELDIRKVMSLSYDLGSEQDPLVSYNFV